MRYNFGMRRFRRFLSWDFSMKNFRIVLAPAVLCAALVSGAVADEATPQTVANTARLEREVALRLTEESRISLSLRQQPLAQMLALVESTTAVRFRCATLPDAPITVNAQDAPLFATLDPLFQEMGFATRRDGLHVFLFSNRIPGRENAHDTTAAWTTWQGTGSPAAGWANPQPKRVATSGKVTADSLINASPLKLQWNAPQSSDNGRQWTPADMQVDATRKPGVAVTATTTGPVWMRWPMDLREVPAGAQLSLETPCDVTLFVNGAPLVAGRRGSLLVNLDKVLRTGENCIALHWRETASAGLDPLLRYEWFVAGKPDAAPAAQGGTPQSGTPKVTQPLLITPGTSRPGEAGTTLAGR